MPVDSNACHGSCFCADKLLLEDQGSSALITTAMVARYMRRKGNVLLPSDCLAPVSVNHL